MTTDTKPDLEAQHVMVERLPPPAYEPTPAMVVAQQPPADQEWQTSLYGCCADCHAFKITAKTIICPCITYGKTSDRIMHQAVNSTPHPTGGDACSPACSAYGSALVCTSCAASVLFLPCFSPIAMSALRFFQRTQLRSVFGIAGHPIKDCLASFFCGTCTLVQAQRELDLREQEGQIALIDDVESTETAVVVPPPKYMV